MVYIYLGFKIRYEPYIKRTGTHSLGQMAFDYVSERRKFSLE